MRLLARARAEIVTLQPYSSARMEAGAATIMLNANESPWPPADGEACQLNRYPDPQPVALRAALADLYAVAPENVLIGRGSDEAIDLLVRAFCAAGRDAIAISTPTFGMYAVSARIQGAAVIEVPLGSMFELNADALLASLTDAVKLVFVCTPNNPTGNLISLAVLGRLADALRDRALLVVDEAYIEFAGGVSSATTLLKHHDNIAVIRTLSKAHALAGARIGALLAAPPVVELLRRIQAPYPLSTPCVDAALCALAPVALAETAARIEHLCSERAVLAKALAMASGVHEVFSSSANFLCVRFIDAHQTYRRLLVSGIVVRDLSHYPGLSDCLRITVGNSEENSALLVALGVRRVAA